MRKRILTAAMLAALSFAQPDYASVAHAAGTARGTREQITFEGVCKKKKEKPVPAGYDGLNWSGITAIGRDIEEDPGYQSVVRGNVAAETDLVQGGSSGVMRAVSGTFSLRSGHFAACCSQSAATTFLGYRNGTLVGQLAVTLDPTDTRIAFDRTFAHIDQLVIETSGESTEVFMDNLVVAF